MNRQAKVNRLVAMGYNQVEARETLALQGWDFDNAANYLSAFSNPKRAVVGCVTKNACFLKPEHAATPAEAEAQGTASPESLRQNAERGREEREGEQLVSNRVARERAAEASSRPQDTATTEAQNRAVTLAQNNNPAAVGKREGEAAGSTAPTLLEEGAGAATGRRRRFINLIKKGVKHVVNFGKKVVAKVKGFFKPKPKPKPQPKPAVAKKETEAPKKKEESSAAEQPAYPMRLRPVVYPVGTTAEEQRRSHEARHMAIKHQPGDPFTPEHLRKGEDSAGAAAAGTAQQGEDGAAEREMTAAERDAAEKKAALDEAKNRLGAKSTDPFSVEMRRRIASDLTNKGWLSGPPGWLKRSIIESAERQRKKRAPLLRGAPDAWPVIVPVRVREDSSGRLHNVWSHPVVPQAVPLRDAIFSGPLPRMKAPGTETSDSTDTGAGTPGTPGDTAIPEDEV